MNESAYRRRHERVGRKWKKLKPKAKHCPNCRCHSIGLNDFYFRKFKRFFLECENCHWCGKSYPTIRMAIRSWNKERA